MITSAELQAKIDVFNALTGESVYFAHVFYRTNYPYVLGLIDANGIQQTIMRGTKTDLYVYLDGAITGINTYKHNHNIA